MTVRSFVNADCVSNNVNNFSTTGKKLLTKKKKNDETIAAPGTFNQA
jgi:hypothetical protein